MTLGGNNVRINWDNTSRGLSTDTGTQQTFGKRWRPSVLLLVSAAWGSNTSQQPRETESLPDTVLWTGCQQHSSDTHVGAKGKPLPTRPTVANLRPGRLPGAGAAPQEALLLQNPGAVLVRVQVLTGGHGTSPDSAVRRPCAVRSLSS